MPNQFLFQQISIQTAMTVVKKAEEGSLSHAEGILLDEDELEG